jgi:hypothetical protein
MVSREIVRPSSASSRTSSVTRSSPCSPSDHPSRRTRNGHRRRTQNGHRRALANGKVPVERVRRVFGKPRFNKGVGPDGRLKYEPTMNFGWLQTGSSDLDVQSVVLHEFGRALGLIHEHQAREAAIAWNKELIYCQLGGSPNYWSHDTVDHNVFDRLAKDQLNFTTYDRSSKMHYFFPKEWTTDNIVFAQNTSLSELDKSSISSQYPNATSQAPA